MAEQKKKGAGLGAFMQRQGGAEGSAPAAPGSSAADTPQRRKERRRLKDGREQLLTYLQPAGIRELKLLGIDLDRPVTDLVTEAVNDLLQKYRRPPVA